VTRRDGAGSTAAVLQSLAERHQRAFPTVSDMVYEIIRDGILQGAFAPGERLRQDELAEAIGVSRIPVRSALLQLESDGLIQFNPYKGAVVTKLSSDEMREIYELRAVLESHALRKAVNAMTPEKLAHLEQLARELNEIKDGEEFLNRRNDFYRELYDREHQARTVDLIERLRAEAGRYWLERKVEYVSVPGQRDHLQLIEFIQAGDIDGAVAWLQDHLHRVCDDLVALMENEQPKT
jgi:DNA-binding GntR family transcriptional regulator